MICTTNTTTIDDSKENYNHDNDKDNSNKNNGKNMIRLVTCLVPNVSDSINFPRSSSWASLWSGDFLLNLGFSWRFAFSLLKPTVTTVCVCVCVCLRACVCLCVRAPTSLWCVCV